MFTCQHLPCYVPSKLHFQQDYIKIIKFRNASSQFYRRHYDLVSKYDTRLKSLLLQGLSELKFYADKVYKERVTLFYCDVSTLRSSLGSKQIQKQILQHDTLMSIVQSLWFLLLVGKVFCINFPVTYLPYQSRLTLSLWQTVTSSCSSWQDSIHVHIWNRKLLFYFIKKRLIHLIVATDNQFRIP